MSIVQSSKIELLFAHVPKRSSYYKTMDEFISINYMPMGVFGLCDILNKNNIASRIKHIGIETILNNNFSIASYIKENNIGIVGLSLHWHYQSYDVINVAQKIKALNPDTVVVLGGLTATRFANEIMSDYQCIDFIIKGDSEKGIIELYHALESQATEFINVSNCVWRSGQKIIENPISFVADTEMLQHVDYANLEYLDHYQEYVKFIKVPFTWSVNGTIKDNLKRRVGGAKTVFPLMVGRGCPVNCSFCGGSNEAQKRLCGRQKPFFLRQVQSVVDTMEKAISYGYESFIVCFDPTPNNDQYYIELFAEVRKRKLTCGMGFESWGLPTKRLIFEFKRTFNTELSYIAVSPETGSEEIRKKNKGFFYTNQQLFDVMKWIEDEGVTSVVYLTIGLPGETSSHIEETVSFSRYIRKRFRKSLSSVLLLPVQLEPGSPMFENPSLYGITSRRANFKDFYEFHGRPESNPYTFFDYVTDSLQEARNDIGAFTEYLCGIRCEKFCIINMKRFNRFLPQFVNRKICAFVHKSWAKKGFGAPAQFRKTFT